MKLFFSLLLSLWWVTSGAQNHSNENLKQQCVRDWERAKAYTREYLDAMPVDKYSFRPVNDVRSFAEQMMHLAQANVLLASTGTGFKDVSLARLRPTNFGKLPTDLSKDSLVYYVAASYDFAINAIKHMDFEKSGESASAEMPAGKRTTTRWGWLLKAFEHQTHHRGQCTVYLRLAGIVPPVEKLWEQQ
jgi:uncharacterized damage-inducible protein DinB